MNGADLLRQISPVIFLVLMMIVLNLFSMAGPTHGSTYQYSLGANYQFREQL